MTEPDIPSSAAADLYLDLLARSLAGLLENEVVASFEPRRLWTRRLWYPLRTAIRRAGIDVVRRTARVPGMREEGREWPLTQSAKTMIGLSRLDNIRECIRSVVDEGVPGDLLEAGTWRGGAAIFMRAALEAFGDPARNVWVADSFQGVPKPDVQAYPADRGDIYWSYSDLAVPAETVKANFASYCLLDDRVKFLPGWFSESLPSAPIGQLAVLRADGDLYESTLDILTNLYPHVSHGGFVIIDDYGCVPGCRRAVDEFRAERGITDAIEVIDWTGVFWRRSSDLREPV